MRFMSLTGTVLAGMYFAGAVMAADALTPCGADQLQEMVGQNIDATDGVFPDTARIIPPNSAVTQDFRPGRVNVDLDEAGLIVRIWCG